MQVCAVRNAIMKFCNFLIKTFRTNLFKMSNCILLDRLVRHLKNQDLGPDWFMTIIEDIIECDEVTSTHIYEQELRKHIAKISSLSSVGKYHSYAWMILYGLCILDDFHPNDVCRCECKAMARYAPDLKLLCIKYNRWHSLTTLQTFDL